MHQPVPTDGQPHHLAYAGLCEPLVNERRTTSAPLCITELPLNNVAATLPCYVCTCRLRALYDDSLTENVKNVKDLIERTLLPTFSQRAVPC
jgi:hypothetical protein